MTLTHRLARHDDLDVLGAVMAAAIDRLQADVLAPEQIAASHGIMGVDSTLIDDATYYVVESGGQIIGCGGWSRRATLYGGDHTTGRSDALLDPASDPARIRAMYTHPDFTRRGVGRLIMSVCEQAAISEGFTRLELMATLAGRPLYVACGFVPIDDVVDTSTGTTIPLVRMVKEV